MIYLLYSMQFVTILRNCIIIQITEIVPIILLVRLEVMFGIRCYAASSEYMLLQLLVIKKINYSSKIWNHSIIYHNLPHTKI